VQVEELAPRLARVEARLLERDADPPAGGVRVAGDVDAGHFGASRGDREQGGEHAHRSRLPGSVRAEEPEDLPGRDREVYAADGLDRAFASRVVLDKALGHDGRGSSFVHRAPVSLCGSASQDPERLPN
jgi:hypothetical protein